MRMLAIALVMFTPTIGFAQLPTAGEAMGKTESHSDTAKVRTVDFDKGDEVEGEIIKPLDEGVHVPLRGKSSSLINVRSNFVDEVIKSVEDI